MPCNAAQEYCCSSLRPTLTRRPYKLRCAQQRRTCEIFAARSLEVVCHRLWRPGCRHGTAAAAWCGGALHATRTHRDFPFGQEFNVPDALAGARDVACCGGDGGSSGVGRRRRHCATLPRADCKARRATQDINAFYTVSTLRLSRRTARAAARLHRLWVRKAHGRRQRIRDTPLSNAPIALARFCCCRGSTRPAHWLRVRAATSCKMGVYQSRLATHQVHAPGVGPETESRRTERHLHRGLVLGCAHQHSNRNARARSGDVPFWSTQDRKSVV